MLHSTQSFRSSRHIRKRGGAAVNDRGEMIPRGFEGNNLNTPSPAQLATTPNVPEASQGPVDTPDFDPNPIPEGPNILQKAIRLGSIMSPALGGLTLLEDLSHSDKNKVAKDIGKLALSTVGAAGGEILPVVAESGLLVKTAEDAALIEKGIKAAEITSHGVKVFEAGEVAKKGEDAREKQEAAAKKIKEIDDLIAAHLQKQHDQEKEDQAEVDQTITDIQNDPDAVYTKEQIDGIYDFKKDHPELQIPQKVQDQKSKYDLQTKAPSTLTQDPQTTFNKLDKDKQDAIVKSFTEINKKITIKNDNIISKTSGGIMGQLKNKTVNIIKQPVNKTKKIKTIIPKPATPSKPIVQPFKSNSVEASYSPVTIVTPDYTGKTVVIKNGEVQSINCSRLTGREKLRCERKQKLLLLEKEKLKIKK